MKVLALSDIHSEQRVIDGIRSLITRNDYDGIFIVGDIVDHNNVTFFENILTLIGDIPYCIIPGNIDEERVRNRMSGDNYADLRKIRFKNKYEVFGIGGGLRGPFHTPYEYYDDELWEKIGTITLSKPCIMLSHAPPYGYFDDIGGDIHIGSKSVLRFMQKEEPFLLLCGHVHETQGHIKAGKTNIIKLGPAKNGNAAEINFNFTNEDKNTVEIKWIKLFK
jgi:Icc-related predicted phosphoesterase